MLVFGNRRESSSLVISTRFFWFKNCADTTSLHTVPKVHFWGHKLDFLIGKSTF